MKNAPRGARFLVANSDDVYAVERTAEFLDGEGVRGINALPVEELVLVAVAAAGQV